MLKPIGTANYITTPIILPEFPPTLTLWDGSTIDTRKALPIARAVLLEGVKALKKIPGGATRTVYSLERATFHLKRVKVLPRKRTTSKNPELDPVTEAITVLTDFLDYLREHPQDRHGLGTTAIAELRRSVSWVGSARRLQVSQAAKAKDLDL
jgi:hypothetical protein